MHLMQKLNLKVPPFLVQATPQGDVDDIVRDWQRKLNVVKWQNFFQRTPLRETAPVMQSPVLRARLKDEFEQ